MDSLVVPELSPDMVLGYISQILMEEDMDDKFDVLHRLRHHAPRLRQALPPPGRRGLIRHFRRLPIHGHSQLWLGTLWLLALILFAESSLLFCLLGAFTFCCSDLSAWMKRTWEQVSLLAGVCKVLQWSVNIYLFVCCFRFCSSSGSILEKGTDLVLCLMKQLM